MFTCRFLTGLVARVRAHAHASFGHRSWPKSALVTITVIRLQAKEHIQVSRYKTLICTSR
eukprot:1860481-Alexandrium_andersonii.AAC.1